VSLFITGFGESLPVLIALIGLVYFPGVIRIVRAQAMTQVNLGYVKAAQLRGEGAPLDHRARDPAQHARRGLRGVRHPHVARGAAALDHVVPGPGPVAADARLGPDGLGGVGQISFAPWLVLFPAVFISTLVIGLNFGAEALANALGMDAARGYGRRMSIVLQATGGERELPAPGRQARPRGDRRRLVPRRGREPGCRRRRAARASPRSRVPSWAIAGRAA
jgi:hypothetical protein